jgi:predicted DNA-binding transcriptional regulator YafY
MKTSARLLELLALLQTRREWAGGALSERLGVDVRTLRRDVERLRQLGYEVASSAGIGGGYRLGAGRELPPLRLGDEDAVTIAVALGSAMTGSPQLRERALQVLVKLEPLLPARLRRRARALHAVVVPMAGAPSTDPGTLATLASACQENERLTFRYDDSRGGQLVRAVEPLRLAHTGRVWYLLAWDLRRSGWRTFRVDRLDLGHPIRVGPRFLPRQPPEDAAQMISRSISVDPYALEVRLKLAGTPAQLAERVPSWVGVLAPLDARHSVLCIGGNTLEEVLSQVVLAGVDFELLGPRELAPGLRRLGRRLIAGAARAPAPSRRVP